MGTIDLDPATSVVANENVLAAQIYTQEDNGLVQDWKGRVWMNPPYAQPLIRQFSEKLAAEFRAGRVTEAIVLVNNATETKWFQGLSAVASGFCYPKGRIKFWCPGKISQPLQGQAILYLGPNSVKFAEEFAEFGTVWEQRFIDKSKLTCVICESHFSAKRDDAKTCSAKCRKALSRR